MARLGKTTTQPVHVEVSSTQLLLHPSGPPEKPKELHVQSPTSLPSQCSSPSRTPLPQRAREQSKHCERSSLQSERHPRAPPWLCGMSWHETTKRSLPSHSSPSSRIPFPQTGFGAPSQPPKTYLHV